MKKAQLETMGLVIIVALLAFIFIFVLQILAKPSPNYLNDRYLQLNADNLRSVILKTSLCQDISIKDEIVNCNNNQVTQCGLTCDNLNNVIAKIIENSLNVTKKYNFEAGIIKIEKNFNSCKNIYTAAQEPIPYSNFNVALEIC